MNFEWSSRTLGELSVNHDGKRKPVKESDRTPGPYPYYGASGIVDSVDGYLFDGPHLLIGEDGENLRTRQAPIAFMANGKFWVNNHAHIVTGNELAETRFLMYALLNSDINPYLTGAVMPKLTQGNLNRILLPCPPREVQSEIVGVLGLLDDRIAHLRETNATLEAIAQALFKSWFVDFDPVRAKQQGLVPVGMDEATAALFPGGFNDSALGSIPLGWQVRPIAEVVEAVFDGPHATPPESDEGPVFLGIKNLTGAALDLGDVRHIAEADFAQWTKRATPRPGDIVFSYEATLGFFALIPPGLRCCLGRRLALIRPQAEQADGHFWFHQFIAAPFQRLLAQHTIQGATVNRIALKHFPSYSVLCPPAGLRTAFDACVAPLWSRIHANQAQAQTLTAVRDNLLPRLISGQLRLPAAEALLA